MGFYDSPSALKQFLQAEGLALKKRFGQNFLIDPNIRRVILDVLNLTAGETVWEIGPGLGAMTDSILSAGVILRCFEIDHGFVRVLQKRYAGRENFSLVSGDVIRTWKAYREESPQTVFGNLPYSVGGTLIGDFLEYGFSPKTWVFMVQKEVARRMVAAPNTSDYSSFSALCQTFCTIQILFDVNPGAFYPRPKVVSTLVKVSSHPSPPEVDLALFTKVIRASFAHRRKKLINTLGVFVRSLQLEEKEVFLRSRIDPSLRGESLTPQQFLYVTRVLQDLKDS